MWTDSNYHFCIYINLTVDTFIWSLRLAGASSEFSPDKIASF